MKTEGKIDVFKMVQNVMKNGGKIDGFNSGPESEEKMVGKLMVSTMVQKVLKTDGKIDGFKMVQKVLKNG